MEAIENGNDMEKARERKEPQGQVASEESLKKAGKVWERGQIMGSGWGIGNQTM